MKYYTLNDNNLRKLVHDSLTLQALEGGGVAYGWNEYCWAIQRFVEENGDPENGIWDLADEYIKNEFIGYEFE